MRVVYRKDILTIVSIENDFGTITAFPNENSVIQADGDTAIKTAIALGLDVDKILIFATQNNIPISMTTELRTVLLKRAKGQEIYNRFLAENETIVIDTQQNLAQLAAFVNVKMMLESGALKTARDIIQEIPDAAFVLTNPYLNQTERKQSYLDEIDNFIISLQ